MTRAVRTLADVVPDQANANRHTPRGRRMLEDSLRRAGAGRSIVVDRDGAIVGGNATAEVWADLVDPADPDAVRVVQTDGRTLVIVQRTDLDLDDDPDGRARFLALADNRVAEASLQWDADALAKQLTADAMPLDAVASLFTATEIDLLTGDAALLGAPPDWAPVEVAGSRSQPDDGRVTVRLRLPPELAARLRHAVALKRTDAVAVVSAGLDAVAP